MKFFSFMLITLLPFKLCGMKDSYDISPHMIIDHPCELFEDAARVACAYATKYFELLQKKYCTEDRAQKVLDGVNIFCKEHKKYPLHLMLMSEEFYRTDIQEHCIKEYALSRKYYPQVRTAYEKKITLLLLNALHTNTHDFGTIFTSFGPEMFYVLRIITQVLTERPDAHIAVNFIHNPFLCHNIAHNFYMKTGKKLDREKDLKTYLAFCRNTHAPFIRMYNEYDLSYAIQSLHSMKKQFTNWTKKHFPLAQCNLTLYNSVEHYLDERETSHNPQLPHADVVSAINLNATSEEFSGRANICDYALLCVKTLLAHEASHNYCLEYKDYSKYETLDIEPTLFTCQLHKPEGEYEYKEVRTAHLPLFYMVKED